MCDPVTAMVVASTALTAGSQVVEGQAAKASADYNASVMRTNAIIARQKADQERQSGDLETRRSGEQSAAERAAFAAQTAAGGVQLGSGSARDVLISSAMQGGMDAAIIRANSQQRQRDLFYEADNLEAQALMTEREGKAKRFGSILAAGGTVLGGASQIMGPSGTMSRAGSSFKPLARGRSGTSRYGNMGRGGR